MSRFRYLIILMVVVNLFLAVVLVRTNREPHALPDSQESDRVKNYCSENGFGCHVVIRLPEDPEALRRYEAGMAMHRALHWPHNRQMKATEGNASGREWSGQSPRQ